MAAVIISLALLMPTALASNSSASFCTNLPNILDLGTCLGTSLDLSMDTSDDILAVVVKLVGCLGDALLALNVRGALAALLQVVQIVLSALELRLGILSDLINPLCAVSNVPGCMTIFSESTTCLQPIVVNLPSGFNLEQCLTSTVLLCKKGTVATDELLVNLIQAVVCLLNTLLGSEPQHHIKGLGCVVSDLLTGVAASSNVVLKPLMAALSSSITTNVGCL